MKLRLALGASCIATAPLFIKAIHMGHASIGAYRGVIGGGVLLALAFWRQKNLRKKAPVKTRPLFQRRKSLLWIPLASLLLSLDFIVWHRAVHYSGAGISTILGNTQVFYVTLIGVLFLREHPSWRLWASIPLAFVGIHLLVGVRPEWASAQNYTEGVWYGLATGLFYAGYILTLRKLEATLTQWSTLSKLGWVSLLCGLILVCVSVWSGERNIPENSEWIWVLALALLPQVVGWSLISQSLPSLPVSVSGLILLLQPVFASLLAAFVFDESLTLLQGAGALLTLIAIYLGGQKVKKVRV